VGSAVGPYHTRTDYPCTALLADGRANGITHAAMEASESRARPAQADGCDAQGGGVHEFHPKTHLDYSRRLSTPISTPRPRLFSRVLPEDGLPRDQYRTIRQRRGYGRPSRGLGDAKTITVGRDGCDGGNLSGQAF